MTKKRESAGQPLPQCVARRLNACYKKTGTNSPLAAGLGGRAGVSRSHGAGTDAEGAEGTESRRLVDGGAKHLA